MQNPRLFAIAVTFAGLALPMSVEAGSAGKQRFPDRGKMYISGFVGGLDGDDNPSRLGNPGSSVAVGVGGGQRRGPSLALEADVLFDARDYDVATSSAGLFGRIDDLELTSSIAVFSVKGIYPISRFEPFVGAGAGLSYSELELTGSFFGFPGTFEKENSFDLVFQLIVGMDIVVSERSNFGLELRSIEASADYGQLSGGSVDIGGRLLSLAYKRHF